MKTVFTRAFTTTIACVIIVALLFVGDVYSIHTTPKIHVIPVLSPITISHVIQHNTVSEYFHALINQLDNVKLRRLSYPIHSMAAFYQFFEPTSQETLPLLKELIVERQQLIFVDLGDEKDERHCIDQSAYVTSISEIAHFLKQVLETRLHTIEFNPNAWIDHREWDVAISCDNENPSSFHTQFAELIQQKLSEASDHNEFFIVWEMDGSQTSYNQMDQLMRTMQSQKVSMQYETFVSVKDKFCANCEQTIRVQSTPRNELEEELRTSEHAIKQMINTYKLSVNKMLAETRSMFHAAEVLVAYSSMKHGNRVNQALMSRMVQSRRTLSIVQNLLSSDAFSYGKDTTELMKSFNNMLSNVQKSATAALSEGMQLLLTKQQGSNLFHLQYYSNGKYYRHSTPKFISFDTKMEVKKSEHDSSYNDDDMSVPLVVFNDLSWQRSEIVELAVTTKDVNAAEFIIEVVDEFGDITTAQLIPNLSVHHAPIEWYRLLFLAKDIPAMGTRSFFLNKRRKFGTQQHYKDVEEAPITGVATFMSAVHLSANSKFHDLLRDVDRKDLLFNFQTLEKRDIVLSNSKQSIGFHRNTGNIMFISRKVDDKVDTFFVSNQFFNYVGTYSQLLSIGSLIRNDWLMGFLLCLLLGYTIGLFVSYSLHLYFIRQTGLKKQDTNMSRNSNILLTDDSFGSGSSTASFFTPRSGVSSRAPANNPFAATTHRTSSIAATVPASVKGFINEGLGKRYQTVMNYLMQKKRRHYLSFIMISFGMVSAIVLSNIIFHDELVITNIFAPYFVGVPIGLLSGAVISFVGGIRKWSIFGVIFAITYTTAYLGQPWMIANRLDSDLTPNDIIVFKGPLVHELNQHYNSSFSDISVLQTTRLMDTKMFIETESTVYTLREDVPSDLQHDPLISLRIIPHTISGFMNGNEYEASYCSGLKKRRFRYFRKHNPSLLNYVPQTNVAIVSDKNQHLTAISSQHVPMTVFAGRTMEWMLPISSAPNETNEIDDAIKTRLYIGSTIHREVDGESLSLHEARKHYHQLHAEMQHPFFLFTGDTVPTHYHIKYSTAEVKPRSKDGRITTEDEEHEEFEFNEVWKRYYQSSIRPLHPALVQFLGNSNVELLSVQYRTDLRTNEAIPFRGLVIRFMRNGEANETGKEDQIILKIDNVSQWFELNKNAEGSASEPVKFVNVYKVLNEDFNTIKNVDTASTTDIVLMEPNESVVTIVLRL